MAESTPPAARREIEIDTVRRLVDEEVEIGFDETFFTGGEPFILPGLFKLAPEQSSLISVATCKECNAANSRQASTCVSRLYPFSAC